MFNINNVSSYCSPDFAAEAESSAQNIFAITPPEEIANSINHYKGQLSRIASKGSLVKDSCLAHYAASAYYFIQIAQAQ